GLPLSFVFDLNSSGLTNVNAIWSVFGLPEVGYHLPSVLADQVHFIVFPAAFTPVAFIVRRLPATEYVRLSLFGVNCAELNFDFSIFSCQLPFHAFESDLASAGCGNTIAAAKINPNFWCAFMA